MIFLQLASHLYFEAIEQTHDFISKSLFVDNEMLRLSHTSTLECGINVAPGKFGKKNKGSPIYTLQLYYFEVRNKAVAPGKKVKKLISIGLCLFRTLEYFNKSDR